METEEDRRKRRRREEDDWAINPGNPAFPISPLNPGNPTNPFFPTPMPMPDSTPAPSCDVPSISIDCPSI